MAVAVAVAVVFRCCSSSHTSPSISGHISRRSPEFNLKAYLDRKLASIPFRRKKSKSLPADPLNRAFQIHQIPKATKSLQLEFNNFRVFNSGENIGIGAVPPYGDVIAKNNANQGLAVLHFPIMALLVTNALMLIIPFEALAETCDTGSSVFTMPILLFVALVGATVGGLLARQRRGELERLNEQLRQINAALRRQAKIESYAPSLSYAPVGGRISDIDAVVDTRKQELISCLKTGKNFLRNRDPEKAFEEFKVALKLAQDLRDPLEEKKAARGLGASLQRQGKFREAIKYHSMVLEISEREGENSGNTEAFGAIADCYTEVGDFERAGDYYDSYIARLKSD